MTTKWRPNKGGDNIYIIPDIHGMLSQLQLILKSILPLRKNEGVNDKIIFLGDYIDRHTNSPKILDLLIDLKKKYGEKIVLLKGNHESLFLDALDLGFAFPSKYDFWFANGGAQTLIGYLERHNLPTHEPHRLMRSRIKDLVPQEHVSFLKTELKLYYELDDNIFVHAGVDPMLPLEGQDEEIFTWDRSLYGFVKKMVGEGKELPWDKIIWTGHNTSSEYPFLNNKFNMLDISSSNQILCCEINSKEIVKAQKGVSRLVKIKYEETKIPKPIFARVINPS